MPGGVVLAGGNEFRSGCIEMDRAILASISGDQPRVLIVPTAAVTGPQKAANDGVVHFSSLGAAASRLMVLEAEHANDDSLISPVSDAAAIYFTGGSPDHLLSTIKGSKLFNLLQSALANGAVVGGSSAGAMVMGSKMRRPRAGGWVDGLGVVPGIAVLPHHEGSDPASVAQDLAQSAPADLVFLGIDAQSCCFGHPGNWQALGSGKVTVYKNGTWQTFNSGEKLPTDV